MKPDSHYIVSIDDQSSLTRQFSIYRHWRRLHRQQRTFIIAFILILLLIYIGFRSHSNKLVKQISYEQHREIINKDKELWQKREIQINPFTIICIVLIFCCYSKENNPLLCYNISLNRDDSVCYKDQLTKVKIAKQVFSTPKNEHQVAVRDAMQHAWKAYRTYAWGFDELQPISKRPSSWFGLGLTIVDAIDTLYIMNMTKEYDEAREWIATSFDVDSPSVDKFNSHFEITIRILGGLLSIYHLTADEIFLKRATEIGDRLLLNFNTSSGLPSAEINIKRKLTSNYQWTADAATAEVGTVQLEMRDLSRITGDKKYEEAADKSAATLHSQSKTDGLVPIAISSSTGHFSGSVISFGARGDSYYEYLLKQWLQTGQTRSTFWDDWIESIGGVRKHLWRMAYPEKIYFVGELMGMSQFSPKMDHLACFLAGNMALGWHYRQDLTYLLDMAKNLTKTCYKMYTKQATGLSPEIVYFNINSDSNESTIIVKDNDAHNLLRPEVIESLYYLYHLTNDTIYQTWGWTIFQSFEKYTRLIDGYSSISDVRHVDNVRPRDKMESFFLAETLKYFYLLFGESNLLPFNQWIFNTEAHPLPIYTN